MNQVVGRTIVFAKRPGEEPIEITVEIGSPYKYGEDPEEWACSVALTPLFNKLHDVHGSDSLQALSLALNFVKLMLQDVIDRGGTLGFVDSADRFPFDAYFPADNLGQLRDMTALSDQELDALLLARCKSQPQKIAMVISVAMGPYGNWDEKRLGDRIASLITAGKLLGDGDIRQWRHGEIRLP